MLDGSDIFDTKVSSYLLFKFDTVWYLESSLDVISCSITLFYYLFLNENRCFNIYTKKFCRLWNFHR